jgi:hypothetical protein
MQPLRLFVQYFARPSLLILSPTTARSPRVVANDISILYGPISKGMLTLAKSISWSPMASKYQKEMSRHQ